MHESRLRTNRLRRLREELVQRTAAETVETVELLLEVCHALVQCVNVEGCTRLIDGLIDDAPMRPQEMSVSNVRELQQ